MAEIWRRETERQRDRDTERHRETQRDTVRETHRETQRREGAIAERSLLEYKSYPAYPRESVRV